MKDNKDIIEIFTQDTYIEIEDNQEDIESEELDEIRNARKFLNLAKAFEVSAQGLEENMTKRNKEIAESYIDDEDVQESVIEIEALIDDFSLIRKTLKSNIVSISGILSKYSEDLLSSHAEDVSGSVLLGYSELIKASNSTMKLLIDTYDSVSKTQLNIKKLKIESKSIDDKQDKDSGTINIQNNFIGSTSDILKKIKGL